MAHLFDEVDRISFVRSAAHGPGQDMPPGSPSSDPCTCPQHQGQGPPTDPLYMFSGEYYEAAEDFQIPGRGVDFVWARKYRSQVGPTTEMGNGWDYAYNIRMEADGDNRVLFDGNTRGDTYEPRSDGSWTRNEFFQKLHVNDDDTYTLTFDDGGVWNFNPLDGSPEEGKISSTAGTITRCDSATTNKDG